MREQRWAIATRLRPRLALDARQAGRDSDARKSYCWRAWSSPFADVVSSRATTGGLRGDACVTPLAPGRRQGGEACRAAKPQAPGLGTRLRPICSKRGTTSGQCKNYSGTKTSARRWYTPTYLSGVVAGSRVQRTCWRGRADGELSRADGLVYYG